MQSTTSGKRLTHFQRWASLCIFLSLSLTLAHNAYAQSGTIRLGKPFVLSATDSELIFELPLTLPVAADDRSYVGLANPLAHNQKGMNYPAWLSDAVFQLKQGNLQRPTLRITPQRGNPEPTNDLLLEFVVQGQRYFQPYHLLLEQPSNFEGKPIPAQATVPNAAQVIQANQIRPRQTDLPSQPLLGIQAQTKPVKTQKKAKPRHSAIKPKAAADLLPQVPPQAAVQPSIPVDATSAPAAQPPAPAITNPLPAMQPKREVSFWQQLGEWQTWAIGSLLFLFIGYLCYRLWLARRARLEENAPLLTRKTEFRNTDPQQFSNTVFGLGDQNANGMHQQWFNQQNAQNMKNQG